MASTNEAKIKFNADCKEFNAQIKAANASLKEMRAELNLNNEQMKNGGDALDLLWSSYNHLASGVDAAAEKVEAMRGKVQAAIDNYGEGSVQVDNWRAELAKAELEQEKVTQQLEDCRNSISQFMAEQRQAESATAEYNARIQDQQTVLDALKSAYVEAALQYGENSDECRLLGEQIEKVSSDLQENKGRMEEAKAAAEGYDSSVQEQVSHMDELRAALALNTTAMKEGGDQTDLLLERYQILNQQYQEQGRVVDDLYQKMEQARALYGEESAQVAQLSAELFKAENEQRKFGHAINDCVAEIDRMVNSTGTGQSAFAQLTTTISSQESELQRLKQQYIEAALEYGENSEEARSLGEQISALSGRLNENRERLDGVTRAADSYDQTIPHANEVTEKLKKSLEDFGGVLDKVDATITKLVKKGLRELIKGAKEVAESIIETGMETETSFAKVSAVMQATDDDMALLRQRALEVQQGVSPLPYTLNECATAYYYMGLAGWDAQQSGDALKDTLSLVMASGEDLANVSDIVTDNITAFGLSSKDTKYMVDVLAQTMRSTNTDVGLLGQTFKYAAAPAHAAGYALEDVALAAGLMANNGIKGSQAGTALRQMFNSLAEPSDDAAAAMDRLGISLTDNDGKMLSLKGLLDQTRMAFAGFSVNLYDAEGNLRDYDDILREVEETNQDYVAAEKLKAAAQIYGVRAMSSVLSIVNMSEEEYRRVTAAIYDYDGACEDMAATMTDTLQGDVKMLNTSLNTLANQIYDQVCPSLREFVQTLTDWVNSDESVELIDQIGTELTNLLKGVLADLPNIISTVSGILQTIPSIINGISSAVQFVTGHINEIVTAIKAVLAVWLLIKSQPVIEIIASIVAGIVALIAQLVAQTGATGAATVAQTALNVALSANPIGAIIALIAGLVVGIVALVGWIKGLVDNTEKCKERLSAVAASMGSFSSEVAKCKPQLQDLSNVTSEYGRTTSEIDSLISEKEKSVTAIIKQAADENRQLRQDELAEIRAYNDEIARLEEEKAAIYKTNLEVTASTIAAQQTISREQLAQYVADTNASYEQATTAIDNNLNAQLQRIYQYHQEQGTLNSEAHQRDILAAQQAAEAEKAALQQRHTEILSIALATYEKSIDLNTQMWSQTYQNNNKGREAFTQAMEQMDLDATQAWLSMVSTIKTNGGQVTAETEQTAKTILLAFKDMPDSLEEAGREILLGLIDGMDSEIPALSNAADMTCDEIVDTVLDGLEIHSPSRVMISAGQNVVQGLADGMKNKSSAVNSAASDIAKSIIDGLTPDQGSASAIGQNTAAAVESGLNGKQGAITGAAQGIAKGVVSSLTPDAGAVKNVGANTIAQDQSGLQSKLSAISSTAKSINQNVVKSLTPDAGAVKNVGANTIAQDQQGMQSKSGALNNTAKTIAQGAVKSLTPDGSQVKGIGGNIVAGIDSGMQEKKGWLGSRISDFVSGIIGKFKSAFKIGSPSRVMAEDIGEWLPAGIGQGIENNAGAAIQPLKALVNSMTGAKLGFGNTLGGFSLDISSRIEDHMMDAFNNNSQFSMMERMADAMERLANIEFIVNMDISGQRVAQATASASDSVSGTRINLRERGLALE